MNSKFNKLIMVILALIMVFNVTTYASAADISVEKKYSKLIENLIGQDFINAGNSLKNESNFKKMSEKDRDYYIMNYIVENYNPNQSISTPLGGADLPESYYGLNPEEQVLAKKHPFQATQYYISSQVAFNYTQTKFGYNGTDDSSDAFRHAFWSSVLTMRIGQTDAKTWTDAHEAHSTGLPRSMDLWNNTVGRGYGRDYVGSSAEYATPILADEVYTAIKAGEGKKIVNGVLTSSAF